MLVDDTMRRMSLGLLIWLGACGSSSSEPIDPLAESYCAACSEQRSCENVVNLALQTACPDETRAYYSCVTDNACDVTACETEWAQRSICMGDAPADVVRERISGLAPSANLGHRGTGPTRDGHPFPENSLSSFIAAIERGADGIELDAEITMDGEIVVMHDDTLDRTTDCTGCVSLMTLDEVRACRLLDGDGNPTEEPPPTLVEVYDAVGADALINIELKVFGDPCSTANTGGEALAQAVLEEVMQIGGQSRTIFSSFDAGAIDWIKTSQPSLYCALLSQEPDTALVEQALALNQDAIHAFISVSADTVQEALDAGLQVTIWTANTAGFMQQQLAKGSTAIITDEPAVLAELLATMP